MGGAWVSASWVCFRDRIEAKTLFKIVKEMEREGFDTESTLVLIAYQRLLKKRADKYMSLLSQCTR
jgi:hypothetical protein